MAAEPRAREVLYAWRPLSCRPFGPPVRLGGEEHPPCHLCFDGAPEDVARCRVAPDSGGREAALVAEIERRDGAAGETVIAFALARPPAARRF